MNKTHDVWLPHRESSSGAVVRLFCFPQAAKGASAFRSFQQHLPQFVEVCPVQLPGRENRLAEPFLTSMEEIVDVLSDVLGRYFDLPFAFYGQSMGALIQFELARRIRSSSGVSPVRLFVVRELAPHLVPTPDITNDQLSDAEFLADPRRVPIDSPMRANAELLELMLPTYRADSFVVERYEYSPGRPLDSPISGFAAAEDPSVSADAVGEWSRHTSADFRLRVLPVSSWEIFDQAAAVSICEAVAEDLEFDVAS